MLTSLLAIATQQLGNTFTWLCTLVTCGGLLLLLHAVSAVTARTGHGLKKLRSIIGAAARSWVFGSKLDAVPCHRHHHGLVLAALVLGMLIGPASAEYTSCERPIGEWIAIDQVCATQRTRMR